MPVSVAVLSQCALWNGLPPEVLKALADDMRLVFLRRREALSSVLTHFDGLGVVLSGQMQALDETSDGKEVALQTVQANEVFGLAELLSDRPPPLTWMAAAQGTSVGLLEREAARAALERPEVALRAARAMAQRVCDTHSLHKVLSVHPVSARVCAWLAWQAPSESRMLEIPTHAELAWQLNTTRESVTRVLQRLQAEGIMERVEAGWQVLRQDTLLEWSRGKGRES
jgi:CRP-like cAMP-binding protein